MIGPGGGVRRPEGDWPELWTVPEVAALFQVEITTVREWAAEGKLSSLISPGGHYRFPASAVRALLDSGRAAP